MKPKIWSSVKSEFSSWDFQGRMEPKIWSSFKREFSSWDFQGRMGPKIWSSFKHEFSSWDFQEVYSLRSTRQWKGSRSTQAVKRVTRKNINIRCTSKIITQGGSGLVKQERTNKYDTRSAPIVIQSVVQHVAHDPAFSRGSKIRPPVSHKNPLENHKEKTDFYTRNDTRWCMITVMYSAHAVQRSKMGKMRSYVAAKTSSFGPVWISRGKGKIASHIVEHARCRTCTFTIFVHTSKFVPAHWTERAGFMVHCPVRTTVGSRRERDWPVNRTQSGLTRWVIRATALGLFSCGLV